MPDLTSFGFGQPGLWNGNIFSQYSDSGTIYNFNYGNRGRRSGNKVKEREFIRKNKIETVMHHRPPPHKFAFNSLQRKVNENNLITIVPLDNSTTVKETNSVSVAPCKRSTLQDYSTTMEELDCSTKGNVINQQQHSILSDIDNNIVPMEIEDVRIASLNAQSLKKDENLGLAIEICKQFNIQIMGVQESWRIGSEFIEFGDNKEKWKWINYGYEKKSRAGVGFILGPDVKVIKTVENLTGRILTVYVKCYGLCLRLFNVYAPTEVEPYSNHTEILLRAS